MEEAGFVPTGAHSPWAGGLIPAIHRQLAGTQATWPRVTLLCNLSLDTGGELGQKQDLKQAVCGTQSTQF